MNKLTAFFKRHRRGIITTTAVLAFDVVMLLVVHPLIANIEDFNTRFFIVVPLAFVIYLPQYSLLPESIPDATSNGDGILPFCRCYSV